MSQMERSGVSIDHSLMLIDESDLQSIREEIYHSSGPGYFVFPDYIPQSFVDSMIDFWTNHIDANDVPQRPMEDIRYGCPNFASRTKTDDVDHVTFHNFFWNEPFDEATHTISLGIQLLRNQIMAKPFYQDLYPIAGYSTSYRIVHSRKGSPVEIHRDWVGSEHKPPDYSRLQATLFLSEKGKDYSGDGFRLKTNQDEWVVMGEDVDVGRGDLVIWRYNNPHAIERVEAEEDQLGFLRILHPPEVTDPPRKWSYYVKRFETSPVGRKLKDGIRQSDTVRRAVMPLYRRIT